VKIKLYIVTWNNKKFLNEGLESLFSSNLNEHDIEVNVISNHSSIELNEEFKEKVNVLQNTLRADFSSGHLTRNWNQSIILGFKDLLKPDCDILVHAQDDTFYYPNWLEKLIKMHRKYSFISYGWGDSFCSYTVDAVKRVGLWDERFTMMYHEADYFFRQMKYNKNKSSINDKHHGRLHNRVIRKIARRLYKTPNGEYGFWEEDTRNAMTEGALKVLYSKHKELVGSKGEHWTDELKENLNLTSGPNYMFYPYFEKNVETLEEQGYVA
jgi:hypothetical protein